MPIRVTCPSCSKTLAVPDSAAGKQGKCNSCGTKIRVPVAVQATAKTPVLLDDFDTIVGSAITDPPPPPPRREKPCPFCGETILAVAAKCRYCGEIIDDKLRTERESLRRSEVDEIKKAAARKPSPFVAMILSLLIPGLGQLYKGQVISAVCWFFATVIGYGLFVVPGLVLHLWCILGAGYEGATRRNS